MACFRRRNFSFSREVIYRKLLDLKLINVGSAAASSGS